MVPFSLVQIQAAGHVNASSTTQSYSNACGKWQMATNACLHCHTHLGKVVFYSSHQERRSISLLFETGLDHICFGQKDISRHDAERSLYRHLGARVYTVLLIFEIWKPPGKERQARNKKGQETTGTDTHSLSWSHPRPSPMGRQQSKSIWDHPALEGPPAVCRDQPSWPWPEAPTSSSRESESNKMIVVLTNWDHLLKSNIYLSFMTVYRGGRWG